MPNETLNYQCPACTGPLHFDGETGKLKCDYCDSIYTVEEIEALFADKTQNAEAASAKAEAAKTAQKVEAAAAMPEGWDQSGMNSDWGADASKVSAYECTSCGAELICEKTTAATSCPYCGNPTIIPGKFAGALKPDYVIPFKVNREKALEALHRHYGGKKLLPKLFSAENHIQEVQGIYVPFWLFDGKASVDLQMTGEQVMEHNTGREIVTERLFYDVQRKGRVEFRKIPVDGSRRMDDALMDSIEPYDYSELKPFSLSYLPGYLADRYDCSVEECAPRADQRAANTALRAVENTARNYTTVRTERKQVNLSRGKVHYALMPVWILNTEWNGQKYTFAMNGQTGQLVGDLPMDQSLYRKWKLIYAGVIAAALYAVQWLIALL